MDCGRGLAYEEPLVGTTAQGDERHARNIVLLLLVMIYTEVCSLALRG